MSRDINVDPATAIRGLGAMRAIGWIFGPILGLALFAAIASVGVIGWRMVMMAAALLLGAFGLYWFVRLVLAIENIASERRGRSRP
jgi:MFS family permease